MKQEDDLDFDVFSQALFAEPVSGQQEGCAVLVDIIGSIKLQADDLDFDVMGQACFQEPVSNIDTDCAAQARRILEDGLRKCARATPFYRTQAARGCREVRPAMRRRPLRSMAEIQMYRRHVVLAGAQAPPT